MYRASCFLAGLALALALNPVTASADQRQERIQINADSGDYDMRSGVQTLSGNVRIAQGELVVEADQGRAFNVEGAWQRVELVGNPTTWRMVMEDGTVTTGRSLQLIYDLIAEQITMIDDARIEDAQGSFTGATLTYNLVSERIEGSGGVELVIEPGERRSRDAPRAEADPPPDSSSAPEPEDDGEAPAPSDDQQDEEPAPPPGLGR